MASSSSSSSSSRCTWKYDVFPSFSGEDVRKSFLSHLLEKLRRKLIITFIDNGIERSRLIAPELLSAIRDSRISIVVFSKKYASSTWCLNELAEIHECFKEMNQMVIPVFYELDPSHVRKQTGEFGKAFDETCEGKTEDVKQRWIRALAEVASIAGYDSRNWSDESEMIEKISTDVSSKLFTSSDDFRDFLGIEAHIEAIMDSKLCLESEEVRMVGIVGPSGIGKSTIARALFNRLSTQFHHRAFVTSKRAAMQDKKDNYSMKMDWAKQLLSEILGQKDIEIESLGMVEQRLKLWKVLIVLDDVDEIELLETLAGRTGWFGFGSRIIVVTQDRHILKSHRIDLIYEVDIPSKNLALQMFCQSAFGQTSPPDGFMELAIEVADLAGNLPLGLNVLGLSLRGMDKEEWVEMLPRLQDGLDSKIEKALRISYDGLDDKDQEIFLYIACLLNGHKVKYIKSVLGDSVNSVDSRLRMLKNKSLIRITSFQGTEAVEMHNLLETLGREIVRKESIYNPGKRRFLLDAEDISDVFSNKTGTEAVLGICFNTSEINGPLFLDENSFQGMYNLRFLKIYKGWSERSGEGRLYLPQGLVYLPRKLRILYWDECPLKSLPSKFQTVNLVKLSMINSKLDKLWEGTQPLGSLKKMTLAGSANLKEIPDLSYAINLKKMDLFKCTSLVTLPSSIQNLNKLRMLQMNGCSRLEVLPADVNLKSLNRLELVGCPLMRSFPKISKNISLLKLDGIAIEAEDSLWIENISKFSHLHWKFCPLRCLPSNFCAESLTNLVMRNSKLEKLWDGVQPLGNLLEMDLSGSENLKEFPNLSKATNLKKLHLNGCKSLVSVPCSIRSLNKLLTLEMKGCTGLESLPTNLNLESLFIVDLSGCSQLKSFPQISTNIWDLFLNYTAIEEVPSWIKSFSNLTILQMRGCKRLKTISSNIFELEKLLRVQFPDCEGVTEFCDAGLMTRISRTIDDRSYLLTILIKVCGILVKLLTLCAEFFKSLKGVSLSFYHPGVCLNFDNCFSLDQNAQKLIIQSESVYSVLPGGEVPKYFRHRSCGSSLTIPLPKSSLLGFKVCLVLGASTVTDFDFPCVGVRWYLRGKTGVHRFHFHRVSVKRDHFKMDHLLVFRFGLPTEEVTESPPELDNHNVKFEFYYRIYGCSHKLDELTFHTEACPHSVQRIKGCGIQLWHVYSSPNDNDNETVEAYIDSSSSSEDEAELVENFSMDDYKSSSSSDDE